MTLKSGRNLLQKEKGNFQMGMQKVGGKRGNSPINLKSQAKFD